MKAIILLVVLAIAANAVAAANTCKPKYSPGFLDTNQCHLVYEVENSYWLPDSYVDNAVCACSGLPTTSYEGNCIRQFLATRMRDSTRYTPAFRQEMAAAKNNYNAHKILQFFDYKAFVMSKFVPLVYEDHVDAYKQCCCPGTPAFFASWDMVATIKVPTCGLVVKAIEMFGSCHQTPGRW